MNLTELVNRASPPAPWEEGDNIPWSDSAFSERMLAEHLNQEHDLASRRAGKVDEQVGWIHETVLGGTPARVLDLACGPGLYTSRLAKRGHDCVGIDFAPAAVEYARKQADAEQFSCRYLLDDVRDASYGDGFGLVMMLFGQFNVFRRAEARAILERAHSALAPGGRLLLEPQTYETVRSGAASEPSWYSAASGLFSDSPHLCLTETFWDATAETSTTRFFVVDAATAEVTRHALSNEAYTEPQLAALLRDVGFQSVEVMPSLVGAEDESQSHSFAVVATR